MLIVVLAPPLRPNEPEGKELPEKSDALAVIPYTDQLTEAKPVPVF
jgi:hypothetical protein